MLDVKMQSSRIGEEKGVFIDENEALDLSSSENE